MKAPACLLFPLKGNSLLRLGCGRSCHPPYDGRLFVATRSPVCFHLGTNLPPKTGKVTSKRAWLESGPYARFVLGSSSNQNIPNPPPPQRAKKANPHSAYLTELPLSGYLASAGSPMLSTWALCFWWIFTSGKSTVPGKVGMPVSPQGADLSLSSKPPYCSPCLPS